MNDRAIANLALILAGIAVLFSCGAIFCFLYMLGEVQTVMRLWGSEPREDGKESC